MCMACVWHTGARHVANAVPRAERSDESAAWHRAPAPCQADHALRLDAQGPQGQTRQGENKLHTTSVA